MRWIGQRTSHLVVVGLQSCHLDLVGQHRLDQLEERVSICALRVERVQKRPGPLLLTVEPVADGRQDSLLAPAGHVDHDSPAVASCVDAVGLHETVVIIR